MFRKTLKISYYELLSITRTRLALLEQYFDIFSSDHVDSMLRSSASHVHNRDSRINSNEPVGVLSN